MNRGDTERYRRPARRLAAAAHGYRREIDGLRAVAVLPVMLFHAGFAAFAGGWLGVDVFFVISGYLITGILVARPRRGPLLARPLLRAPRPPHPAGARGRAPRLRPLRRRLDVAARARAASPRASSPPCSRSRTSASGPSSTTSAPTPSTCRCCTPGASASRSSSTSSSRSLLAAPLALAPRPPPRADPRSSPPPASPSPPGPPATTPSAGFFLLPFRAWELAARRRSSPSPRPPRPRRAPRCAGLAADRRRDRRSPRACPASCRSSSPPPAPRWSSASPAPAPPRPACSATRPRSASASISYSAYLWHQPILAFARIRFGDALPPAALLALGGLALLLAWPTWAFVERPFRRRGTGRAPPPARHRRRHPRRAGRRRPRRHPHRRPRHRASPPPVRAILASGHRHQPAPRRLQDRPRPAEPAPPGRRLPRRRHAARRRLHRRQPRRRAAGRRLDRGRRGRLPLLHRHPQRLPADPRPHPHRRRRLARLRRLRPRRRRPTSTRPTSTSSSSPPAGSPASAPDAFDNGEGGADGPPGDLLTPIGADPATPAARAAAVIATYVAGIEDLLARGHKVVLVYPIPEAGWNVPEELARRREASPDPVQLSTDYAVYLRRQAPILAAFDAIDEPEPLPRPPGRRPLRPRPPRPLHQQPRRPPALLRQQPPQQLRRRPRRPAIAQAVAEARRRRAAALSAA